MSEKPKLEHTAPGYVLLALITVAVCLPVIELEPAAKDRALRELYRSGQPARNTR
jgi:hypothetical protein